MSRHLNAAVALAALSALAPAQQATSSAAPATPLVLSPAAGPATPAELVELVRQRGAQGSVQPGARPGATQGQDPAAAPAQPDPRLQALRAIPFLDRRPATVLKAWAAPEPTPPEPEPAPATASQPESRPESRPESAPAATEPAAGTQPATAAATQPTSTQAADPATAARQQAFEQKRIAFELACFQRDMTLGRWDRVRAFFAGLPEKDRAPAYEHCLRALMAQPQPQQPQDQQVPPHLQIQNEFSFADAVGLAGAAPGGLQKTQVELLAPIVSRALAQGHVLENLLALLRAEGDKPEAGRALSPRLAALLLSRIGQDVELGPFLPEPAKAVADNDREALNLLARLALAQHAKSKQTQHLETAWTVTQAALAAGKIEDKDKEEALQRAVELAPKVRAELGETWLTESFTSRPERGMEILATIGADAAQGFLRRGQDPAFRRKMLELQKTAVDALLRAAPDKAAAWRATLAMLAGNWMREAAHAYRASGASSMGQVWRRDPYGNLYYESWDPGNQFVRAIAPGELVPVQPAGAWVASLDPGQQPHFARVVAQLYLKVNEEEKAFPYIETLAQSNPREAKQLAEEFLRVWTQNHDPNAERRRTSQYMFMYGFEERASGIPLTRSKQERNLAELAVWVAKLRALPIGDLDETLLVNAFTQSHSTAEVYRLESIEKVFGALDKLKPKTLASMAHKMRGNLLDVWRRPATQEQKKTNRNQKDIEREVLRGYEVARTMVSGAIEQHRGHWALATALAAIAHDENNFRQEVAKSSEFAARRRATLDVFAAAAEQYLGTVDTLNLEDESTEAFEYWFHAGLGASDLRAVDHRTQPIEGEPARVRAALARLPEGVRERHMAKFASALFTRLSSVNPAAKYRYLKAGFEIVGDHPAAYEARKVFEYYRDLVTEIRLEAVLDGGDVVGSRQPFGLRVNLRHTREIERESGGFAKYLQNQNNQPYAWNYGRPLENYRDKFQDAATAALQEHFEILSVTFNAEDVRSKAADDYGWRVTPYAYLLLKARGPQVDKIPPLTFDLDFLDTSGYAVLPIGSPAVPLDASREPGEARPFAELEVAQILDERKAEQGKLVLEIKATAKGLVPGLEQLLDLEPADFVVKDTKDLGVSVSRFDDDQERIVSERLWTLTLEARPGLTTPPTRFRFATAKVEGAKVLYQRYSDADLVTAQPEVLLEERYGQRGFPWTWVIGGAALLLLGSVGLIAWRRTRRPSAAGTGLRLPERIDAFSVLGLLRTIGERDGLDEKARRDLEVTIQAIESHYFARSDGALPDLRRIAEEWVRRTG
ncbi:MAG: hypothetical protein IT458_09030 [Planctomycetes bacterium]|nr:hypothetical protein [Planctomycetota bacterium]